MSSSPNGASEASRELSPGNAARAVFAEATGPGGGGADSGARSYDERVAAELAAFSDVLDVHELPAMFHYWSCKYLQPRLQYFGYSYPQDFFAKEIARQRLALGRPVHAISLGAGNGNIEIEIASLLRDRGIDGVRIECLDINPVMLARCSEQAQAQGLQDVVVPVVGDFNCWVPERAYDVVLANQSLHHVVELETLFDRVFDAIDDHGVFLVSDTIGRNGHLRWPEALQQVQEFWSELPLRKRFNVQLRRQDIDYIDWDSSTEAFEGVRAQDILPLLVERFQFEVFIPWGNVIDIFIDRAYGHHHDPRDPADCAFVDRIHECDERGILEGRWTPTHMIGVLRRQLTREPLLWEGLTPAFCVRWPDGSRPDHGVGMRQG